MRNYLYASSLLILLVLFSGFSSANDSQAILPVTEASELFETLGDIEHRDGPAPNTPTGIPHQQLNQNAPVAMQELLKENIATLTGIRFQNTPFSLAGSIGWRLEEHSANGPMGAFIRATTEFAHQHRPSDGSMHMLLPNRISEIVVRKGWGIIHPISDNISGKESEYIMLFGPRNVDELEVVWLISLASYYQARGLEIHGVRN